VQFFSNWAYLIPIWNIFMRWNKTKLNKCLMNMLLLHKQASSSLCQHTLLIASIIHVRAKPTCKTLIFNVVHVDLLIHSKNSSFVVEKLNVSGSIVSCIHKNSKYFLAEHKANFGFLSAWHKLANWFVSDTKHQCPILFGKQNKFNC